TIDQETFAEKFVKVCQLEFNAKYILLIYKHEPLEACLNFSWIRTSYLKVIVEIFLQKVGKTWDSGLRHHPLTLFTLLQKAKERKEF
ncbi:hypothetical protein ACO1MG_13720, partial [Staphylococcus aureus]